MPSAIIVDTKNILLKIVESEKKKTEEISPTETLLIETLDEEIITLMIDPRPETEADPETTTGPEIMTLDDIQMIALEAEVDPVTISDSMIIDPEHLTDPTDLKADPPPLILKKHIP